MRYREPALHVALLLAALLACKSGSSSSAGAVGGDPQPSNEMAVTVEATTLMADYKGNEVRGDAKWKGKLVRVTGIVDDIKKDITDQPYITLGSGAELEIPQVQCTLKNGQESRAASVQHGQRLTLKGRVSGLMMNVLIDDCQVLGGPPAAPPPQTQGAAAPAPRPISRPAPPRRR